MCHLNIECISKANGETLSGLLTENKIDVVSLQETHTSTEDEFLSRGRITGYRLIGETYKALHSTATYAR